jgi:hypothetical protein
MLDNEFLNENNVLLRATSVAERANSNRPQEQATVQNPKPFTVFQPIPGQNAKPIFTVHAYSIEQARAIVAAKVAGETIVIAVTLRPTSPLLDALDGASR